MLSTFCYGIPRVNVGNVKNPYLNQTPFLLSIFPDRLLDISTRMSNKAIEMFEKEG